jgi:hypothetical protein
MAESVNGYPYVTKWAKPQGRLKKSGLFFGVAMAAANGQRARALRVTRRSN